ncbi:MAG: HAMP domain-containing protein, partial [Alphaproteobacteria bacterium]|nr:HAMP domain-containing protein [Alphaproteobacteria bacterium]
YSLRSLQIVYGMAFMALVVIAGVVGTVGLSLSGHGSREAQRVGTLLQAVEHTRGDLFRQMKEVFDYHFLQDPDAIRQYRDYSARMAEKFGTLAEVAGSEDESAAIERLIAAYAAVRARTDEIMDRNSGAFSDAERLALFDTELEGNYLSAAEGAFDAAEAVFVLARARLESEIGHLLWVALAVLLVPIALAALLLLLARGFLQRAFVTPLSEVLQVMSAFGAGQLDRRVPEHGAAEMVALQQAINRMADDLAHSREALVRSEKQATLGALVPVVAHNIRNPLAGIRATAQVLGGPDLSDDVRDGFTGIIGAVDRLENWLGSLLSYLNPLQPKKDDHDLGACVDNALALLEPRLAEKQVAIRREGWDAPVRAAFDGHLVEQAIYGLLANAVEASPEGGTVTVSVRYFDGEARLDIADDGPGLPFAPSPRGLFPGPTTKTYGSGLGIPFAFKICDLHDGRLAFAAAAGGGTQVTLALPAAPAARDSS